MGCGEWKSHAVPRRVGRRIRGRPQPSDRSRTPGTPGGHLTAGRGAFSSLYGERRTAVGANLGGSDRRCLVALRVWVWGARHPRGSGPAQGPPRVREPGQHPRDRGPLTVGSPTAKTGFDTPQRPLNDLGHARCTGWVPCGHRHLGCAASAHAAAHSIWRVRHRTQSPAVPSAGRVHPVPSHPVQNSGSCVRIDIGIVMRALVCSSRQSPHSPSSRVRFTWRTGRLHPRHSPRGAVGASAGRTPVGSARWGSSCGLLGGAVARRRSWTISSQIEHRRPLFHSTPASQSWIPQPQWGRATPRIHRPGSLISPLIVRANRLVSRCRSRASSMPERS